MNEPQHSSSPPSVDAMLRDGIQAVRRGDLATARTLLMQVVEQDERNEKAWLWLSGAVESDEDRRVCLENVLTLNPDNEAARRGLAGLAPDPAKDELAPGEHVVRREVPPVSLAAAILHPEAQIKEWRWRDPAPLQHRQPVGDIQTVSSFDDVWNGDRPLCGYCAQVVADEARQCPRCRRSLVATGYRYPQASVNLNLLGTLAFLLGFLTLFQAYIDFQREAPTVVLALDGLLAIGLLIVSVGVFLRRRWSYHGALIVFSLALAASLLRLAAGFTAASDAARLIVTAVPIGGVLIALLAMWIGVFGAGRDFELAESWYVLRPGDPLRRDGDPYLIGKEYAERSLWAMAIPYWQRAAANVPARIFYQQRLGEAFARLGFYERSLGILVPALQATSDPQLRAAIEEWIQTARRLQASGTPARPIDTSA